MPDELTPRIQVRLAQHPQQQREDHLVQPIGEEDGVPVYAEQPHEGATIPASCLRVLSAPHAWCGQFGPCEGVQADGSCLCDVARAAEAAGVAWAFEPRVDEWGNRFWVYTGEPLQGVEVVASATPARGERVECPGCRALRSYAPGAPCEHCGLPL